MCAHVLTGGRSGLASVTCIFCGYWSAPLVLVRARHNAVPGRWHARHRFDTVTGIAEPRARGPSITWCSQLIDIPLALCSKYLWYSRDREDAWIWESLALHGELPQWVAGLGMAVGLPHRGAALAAARSLVSIATKA